MYFYAQIDQDGKVVCVSQLAAEQSDPSLIAISNLDESLLNKVWNGELFEDPAPPTPEQARRIVTKLYFINLFTDTELKAILTAAKTNVDIELLIVKANLTDSVDMEDPLTVTSVNLLEQSDLIGVGRAAQILSAGIQA